MTLALVGALFRMNQKQKTMVEVCVPVPFVYLFILGTQAVLSVIGVRTVPLYVIKRNRYTITLGTGTPNE